MSDYNDSARWGATCMLVVLAFLVGVMVGGFAQELHTLRETAKANAARDHFRDATKKEQP